ncbi:hypothetical protein P0Y35_04800 [Kiritimatiellaeota bacterium B1221]|nr:hypothetical protein [Kiritimatiellaeota bacterium B1221]
MMNALNDILNSFSGDGQALSLDGFALVLVVYLVLSWLICIMAAFLKVKEVRYYVGLVSMGLTILMALVLGGLCRNFLPDLAASFTPRGLFLFGAFAGVLVCSVPVIQYFWNVSYSRGLACVVCGVLVLVGAVLVVQLLADSNEPIRARLSAPWMKNGVFNLGK